jgi:hypothetical protein
MKTQITSILTVLALAGSSFAGTAPAPKNPVAPIAATNSVANVLFGGYDYRDDAWYSHLGFMHDLDGDLGTGGLFLRGFVGAGQYQYLSGGLPDNNITGTLIDSDIGLGYRHMFGGFVASVFASVHMRDRNLNAIDPANNVGTDWGARIGADITGKIGNIFISAISQYSTVEHSTWNRGRLGYAFGPITIGPEFIYMNDAQFDERRIGGFVQWQCCPSFAIIGSAGNADWGSVQGVPGESFYAGLAFVATF